VSRYGPEGLERGAHRPLSPAEARELARRDPEALRARLAKARAADRRRRLRQPGPVTPPPGGRVDSTHARRLRAEAAEQED